MLNTILPNLHVFAATNPCTKSFLGLETWYNYLPTGSFNTTQGSAGYCTVKTFNTLGSHSSFLLIGIAVIDDLIRIAALVAVGYVIYGGIEYVTSQGSPDATKKAQQTIINALVGVVVSILAASIVAFIGNRLGA